MRDSYVVQQMRDLEGRVSNDLGNILQVCGLMESRIKAMERVFLGTRGALLKLALLQIIAPALVRKTLNRIFAQQQQAQAKAMSDARQAAQKKVLTPAPLAVIAVALLLVFAPGCVSKQKYIRVVHELAGAQAAQKKAEDLASYCQDQQIKLTDVLRKFNQVDAAGQLRKPK